MDTSSTIPSPQPAALQSGLPQPTSPDPSTSASSPTINPTLSSTTVSYSVSVSSTHLHTSPSLRSRSRHRWQARYSPLQPLRHWIDSLEVRNPKTARRIAKLIPAQCPFERDVTLLGHTIAHIPPLCKLNPLYDQFVTLRFRALCYLADECGEDIRSYC